MEEIDLELGQMYQLAEDETFRLWDAPEYRPGYQPLWIGHLSLRDVWTFTSPTDLDNRTGYAMISFVEESSAILEARIDEMIENWRPDKIVYRLRPTFVPAMPGQPLSLLSAKQRVR